VSYYIYDLSELYTLNWLGNLINLQQGNIVNINAGFDETSILLKNKYADSKLTVFDFYDPFKHTEVSIKRARKAYPSYRGTIQVKTSALPLEDKTVDTIFIMFAAHEIRDENERVKFFSELKRILKPTGQIVVAEHLRDSINFLAYNIGFFHFYSKAIWHSTFKTSQFHIQKEIKLTPFISAFILKTDGDTL
jgi:ubiquinone/menaquinone biosynthesis C-methylase UbiE